MAEQVVHRQDALAALRELGPVPCHGRVQVEQPALAVRGAASTAPTSTAEIPARVRRLAPRAATAYAAFWLPFVWNRQGTWTRKHDPSPTRVATDTVPCSASTSRFTMLSPRPAP